MKVLTIGIGEKTYTSSRITAYLSKEAMKISREALETAKAGKAMQVMDTSADMDSTIAAAESLYASMIDLSDRKANLICEVYGNKFTADELEQSLEQSEIDAEVNKIINGVTGIITKN